MHKVTRKQIVPNLRFSTMNFGIELEDPNKKKGILR